MDRGAYFAENMVYEIVLLFVSFQSLLLHLPNFVFFTFLSIVTRSDQGLLP